MQVDVKRVTIEDASEKFIRELRTRHVTQTVIRKFEILLEERLKRFCDAKGIQYLDQLDVETVRDFRTTWDVMDTSPRKRRGPLGPLTAAKELERLKQYFKFCLEMNGYAAIPLHH
jgi:site-specific recombinase XerD